MRSALPFLLVPLPIVLQLGLGVGPPSTWEGWILLGGPTAAILLLALGVMLQARRIAALTELDPLTGLHNRRRFEADLAREVTRAERQRYRLSLVLLDIDHFKAIVEGFGQAEADSVLRRLGAVLQGSVRIGVDAVYRLGGDCFAALMPDVSEAGVTVVIDRIWGQTGTDALPLPQYGAGLSLGLVTREPGETAEAFRRRAEGVLLETQRAKRRQAAPPSA